MLPDSAGPIVRAETDGNIRDTTPIGCNLSGVAYIANPDTYVLSDCGNSTVYLVSPETFTVILCLGDAETFASPHNVCVGDINGDTAIVVSDYTKSILHVYSPTGGLIRTYGPDTATQRTLGGPYVVSVDRSGRIVVCDQNNFRVLRVWSDKGGDHWECLLDKGQLGGAPRCVDIDNDNRRMAVSEGDTIKMHTY